MINSTCFITLPCVGLLYRILLYHLKHGYLDYCTDKAILLLKIPVSALHYESIKLSLRGDYTGCCKPIGQSVLLP